jgi:hypothetical protein
MYSAGSRKVSVQLELLASTSTDYHLPAGEVGGFMRKKSSKHQKRLCGCSHYNYNFFNI